MPSFSNSRSIVIPAPAETVHPLINDFREWQQWSPWEGLDPALRRTYSGPESGVGATYEWAGNSKAGAGTMTIVSSDATRIVVDLLFTAPFAAKNVATFELTPEGDGTRVTWTMSGSRNLLMSIGGMLYFDKAIGKDFQRGLEALKQAAGQR
ncbi:Polyketide cyclase / dehydrase and lipid transport [Gordonia malaquae]|uniref:SRPBCC family protein n=1 Tax=Gordonia malaquae TaxID=410332 RepID=UPI00034DAFE3|nr:SRPBCC family protein [Gordonia malaquae]SED95640.1 Polyketide cyclase / dehydrase and lipid transport [Gordonia malaquae]